MKVLIHTYETAFQNKAGGVHNRIVRLVSELKKQGIHTETGIFGADMQVDFINDGPITIMLEK